MSDNIEELMDDLILYALDALPPDEASEIKKTLEARPELERVIDEHREALANLTSVSQQPAPEHIWDNIGASLGFDSDVPSEPIEDGPSRQPANNVTAFPAQRIANGWMWKVAVAASVAAVVSFGLGRASVGVSDPLETLAQQVAESPGTVTATLEAEGVTAQIVLADSGEGFLLTDNLPALDPTRTYQLWAVTAGGVTSAGVLGSDPGLVAFHTARADEVQALVITEENAGGVITSEGTVIATWGV